MSVLVFTFLLLFRSISSKPNCLDQGAAFITEPSDVVVIRGSDESAEFKCQHTLGGEIQPLWIINFTAYNNSIDSHNHDILHDGTIISVKNIDSNLNNTMYHCQLEVHTLGLSCVYRSQFGRLIVMEYNDLEVLCLAHYDYESPQHATLKQISTSIKRDSIYKHEASYIITYSDFMSGETCGSVAIPTSFCVNMACNHTFNVSSEVCSQSSSIMSVTVSLKTTNNRTVYQSEPQIFDSINHFIQISFDTITSSISLKFINQPKASRKHYSVKYSIKSPTTGCKDLHLYMEGNLFNSNLISLELNLTLMETPEVCFSVFVDNGTKAVNVKGIYKTVAGNSIDGTVPYRIATAMMLICGILLSSMLVVFCLLYRRRNQFQEKELRLSKNEITCRDVCGTLNADFDQSVLSQATCELKRIDKCTTYFGIHVVTKKCLMEKFARDYYHNYQPTKGFGYYELTNPDDEIDPSWNVILTDEKNEPHLLALGSAVNKESKTWRNIYVQSKSVETQLAPGCTFLYCAYSKLVTAYQEEYDVLDTCKESEFVKANITGYQNEWFRYCYFEFNRQTYIKPHQRVIVIKKTGELMTGAGVRHLIGAIGDGSQLLQPPDLSEHPEWKRVFIQSKDLDRTLLPGSKYLFCAKMKVCETVHYEVYDVQKSCNMVKLAKHHIPGFKPELGYGYYEFKLEEFLKPEKNVVLVDKCNRLFTGAGARFFCTGGGYKSDDIRKKKYPPPKLDGTPWKYIFIQSHSDKRELQAGSKFLYYEYQTQQ